MRSNAGMANRQGDLDLRLAQVSAPPVNTLAWLGLASPHSYFTCWRWNRHSVPKRRLLILRREGNTQKTIYHLRNLKLTGKNSQFDVIRDLMKSGANVEVNKKAYLDAFRHSSRERTFVGSVTVVESSRQLRQLDFNSNSILAMYWCSIGCWILPLAWMFRAELYNIVPYEMYLVLPDGFKLLFP